MKEKIEESRHLFSELQDIISQRSFDLDNRKTIGVASLSSSLEYFSAIYILFDKRRFGAGAALLRPQFEAYVKGLWFIHCSPDAQVEKAYNDEFKKEFDKIISGLKHCQAPGWQDVKSIKESYWTVMCGYTHTGKPQLARRFKGNNIQSNYEDSFLDSVLNLSDFIAFRTGLELISVSNGDLEQSRVNDLFRSNKMLSSLIVESL